VNESDTRMLLAKLVAAFPFPTPPEGTAALWTEELAKLPNVEAARAAIDALIREERFWPPLATMLERYAEARRDLAEQEARERGLAERTADPPLDELENKRRARELLDRLNRTVGERNKTVGMPVRGRDEAEESNDRREKR
jgi:hypothetical protein